MPQPDLQAVPQAAVQGDQVRENDKIMLVLAYLGILSLIPLLTVKDSDYVKFHARQGLALMLVWIGGWIASAVLTLIFSAIHLALLGMVVGCSVHLAYLVLIVVGIIKGFKPERWRIPVVAYIADMFGK